MTDRPANRPHETLRRTRAQEPRQPQEQPRQDEPQQDATGETS